MKIQVSWLIWSFVSTSLARTNRKSSSKKSMMPRSRRKNAKRSRMTRRLGRQSSPMHSLRIQADAAPSVGLAARTSARTSTLFRICVRCCCLLVQSTCLLQLFIFVTDASAVLRPFAALGGFVLKHTTCLQMNFLKRTSQSRTDNNNMTWFIYRWHLKH